MGNNNKETFGKRRKSRRHQGKRSQSNKRRKAHSIQASLERAYTRCRSSIRTKKLRKALKKRYKKREQIFVERHTLSHRRANNWGKKVTRLDEIRLMLLSSVDIGQNQATAVPARNKENQATAVPARNKENITSQMDDKKIAVNERISETETGRAMLFLEQDERIAQEMQKAENGDAVLGTGGNRMDETSTIECTGGRMCGCCEREICNNQAVHSHQNRSSSPLFFCEVYFDCDHGLVFCPECSENVGLLARVRLNAVRKPSLRTVVNDAVVVNRCPLCSSTFCDTCAIECSLCPRRICGDCQKACVEGFCDDPHICDECAKMNSCSSSNCTNRIHKDDVDCAKEKNNNWYCWRCANELSSSDSGSVAEGFQRCDFCGEVYEAGTHPFQECVGGDCDVTACLECCGQNGYFCTTDAAHWMCLDLDCARHYQENPYCLDCLWSVIRCTTSGCEGSPLDDTSSVNVDDHLNNNRQCMECRMIFCSNCLKTCEECGASFCSDHIIHGDPPLCQEHHNYRSSLVEREDSPVDKLTQHLAISLSTKAAETEVHDRKIAVNERISETETGRAMLFLEQDERIAQEMQKAENTNCSPS